MTLYPEDLYNCWIECEIDPATLFKFSQMSTLPEFRCVFTGMECEVGLVIDTFRTFQLGSHKIVVTSIGDGILDNWGSGSYGILKLYSQEYEALFSCFTDALYEPAGVRTWEGISPEIVLAETSKAKIEMCTKYADREVLASQLLPIVLGPFHLYTRDPEGNPVLVE